jgi:uncharacterized protein YpmB
MTTYYIDYFLKGKDRAESSKRIDALDLNAARVAAMRGFDLSRHDVAAVYPREHAFINVSLMVGTYRGTFVWMVQNVEKNHYDIYTLNPQTGRTIKKVSSGKIVEGRR